MIAVTPDSRKLAMPDLARSGSFQNSGKTKAPTMLLEGKLRSPDSSSLGIRFALPLISRNRRAQSKRCVTACGDRLLFEQISIFVLHRPPSARCRVLLRCFSVRHQQLENDDATSNSPPNHLSTATVRVLPAPQVRAPCLDFLPH